MADARFLIGIDLGTSNCALSYIDTRGDSGTRILDVAQPESPGVEVTAPTLPSFLYLPPKAEGTASVGRYARTQAAALPGRVVRSAKSWLAAGHAQAGDRILPWASTDVSGEERVSPVEASSRYLAFLRESWNRRFGDEGRFEEQEITVTVPASFDEGAQRQTLEAARLAGLPDSVRLLEEPQAAFYYWLEKLGDAPLTERLPGLEEATKTVLVIDIGGGTTDFSLFDVHPPPPKTRVPRIKRISVSDHLLLGGDNLDLTLAHFLEARLPELTGRQWNLLVAQCRALKERVLETGGAPDEVFPVAIPGEGASLFASTVTATMTREEVARLVIDGFFPFVDKTERPVRAASALREMGLPFASDGAVTRHLAEFLDGRRVDAVLFNGGTLKPRFLQERLLDQIARWQDGGRPTRLENPEMDLAVARGAAWFGAMLRKPSRRIRGGYPHALFLELYREKSDDEPRFLCILPKGFEAGDTVSLDEHHFRLFVDRPVRFQLHFSNRRRGDKAGAVVLKSEDAFHPLPPLQTRLQLRPGMTKPSDGQLDVTLAVDVSETGLLSLALRHAESGERWKLDFNLRKTDDGDERAVDVGVPAARLAQALDRIDQFYGKKKRERIEGSPKGLRRELEKMLGPKEDWNLALLRSLWPALLPGVTRRSLSEAHEHGWLYLAGFALRPGYGEELDPIRMDELWRTFAAGTAFAPNITPWWMLWRRVAGGLDAERQRQVFAKAFPPVRHRADNEPELLLLAGALERVGADLRTELGNTLLRYLHKHPAASSESLLWALGRVMNRTPLYGGATSALPAATISPWLEALLDADDRGAFAGRKDRLRNFVFSLAARRTGEPFLDVSERLRERALAALVQGDASEEQRRVVEALVPVDASAQARLFGEALPAGLRLL